MVSGAQVAQSYAADDRRRALDAAIENLYRVFASYKLGGPVVGCPCCTSNADGERLAAKPLDLLNGGDLDLFARKAVTTFGTEDDLKHFLPRLLEIGGYEGQVGTTEFQIVMSKLGYAGWVQWPSDERAAVEKYLGTLWRYVLGVFPAPTDSSTYLCGIGQIVEDLSPFLATWRADTSLPAMQHLADFIEENIECLHGRQNLSYSFWKEREQQLQQVLSWLAQPDTSLQLETGFFQYADQAPAATLSQAVDMLGWVQRSCEVK